MTVQLVVAPRGAATDILGRSWRVALNIEHVGYRGGGAESYAATIARWLHAAGHEVHVFARDVQPGELPQGVRVHGVVVRRLPGLGWTRALRFARASERAIVEAGPFDLIVGFVKVWHQHVYVAVGGARPASLEAGSRRIRSPLLRRLWWLSKRMSPKQWIFRAIERRQFGGRAGPARVVQQRPSHRPQIAQNPKWESGGPFEAVRNTSRALPASCGHAPHIIAPSRRVAEDFRRYHGVAAERISVVPNGIDPRRSSSIAMRACPSPLVGEGRGGGASPRGAFRAQHGLAPDDVAVLFVARNYALKGLDPLLRAFADVAQKHPQARLVVCGSRRDRRYRRQAQRLGVDGRVLFLGFADDVQACFGGCDLFAFPTFYDPCSLVVPEAMYAGLPAITTRINGASELIREGEDGFVIDDPWDTEVLAQRIGRLVGDAVLRRRMSEAAREHAKAFTLEARAEEMLDALRRAAEDPLASPTRRDP